MSRDFDRLATFLYEFVEFDCILTCEKESGNSEIGIESYDHLKA